MTRFPDPPGSARGASSGLVFPDPFDFLTADAVRHMLRHQDVDRFLLWMREEAPMLHPGVFARVPDTNLWPSFATSLGTGLWNAMPLPRNGFRPLPLPAMQPGDLCRCTSGLDFDDCCALFPPPPPFKADALWTFVAEQLPLEDLEGVAEAGHLSGQILGVVAMRLVDRGTPRRAARLLEKVFASPQSLDGDYEVALDALFDAYDALGWNGKKKRALVDLSDQLKPPLRGVVWARRATIEADQGNVEKAWEFFSRSQQDDPDNPSLAGLEVSLLLHQGRADQASARARFWLSKLKRLADGKAYRHLEKLLKDVVDDPLIAVWQFSHEVEPEHLKRFRTMLADLDQRPLPSYGEAVHHGVASLRTPTSLRQVESQWRDIWLREEDVPFQLAPYGDVLHWNPELAEEWLGFLTQHPEAFDVLSVLDALCETATLLEYPLPVEAQRTFLEPLVTRARGIVDQALGTADGVELPWDFHENRPALRLLRRQAFLWAENDRPEDATGAFERLLTLDARDAQGIRAALMDHYLRQGDDEAALALSTTFDDDTLVEITYGRVLALFRLGRRDEAHGALQSAFELAPLVWWYLTGRRRRKPLLEPGRVTHGGADEAWYYRQEMLPVWKSVRGLMRWLRASVKV